MAAIQAKPSGGLFTEKNLPRALELLDKAAKMEFDIAAFPEGYPSTGEKELCKKARDINSYIIATMLQKTQAGKYGSICILISPEGEVIGRQGKTTLLWVFEEGLFEPTDSLPLHNTKYGKLGILRCSEIIYPEPMSILTMMGADIVFVVSNWNANVIHLWHRIILVRSWENWMPIVGVNTAEWTKSRLVYADFELEPRYGGYSVIVVPEDVTNMDEFIVRPYGGENMFTEERLIKAKAGKDEEILVADVCLKLYSDFRWKVFFRNRKLKFNMLEKSF
ncbi:MAG: carbon-nitrogen hydrolase family protein [Nitrososphaerota archaeon]|nr:carbon-nitrogen hydrolase family protein [Aigarchaeota archaeon]MDW8076429.1 carbon-nitrogen hydrolase family protein [Nitrososphaerota archaeon]